MTSHTTFAEIRTLYAGVTSTSLKASTAASQSPRVLMGVENGNKIVEVNNFGTYVLSGLRVPAVQEDQKPVRVVQIARMSAQQLIEEVEE